MTTKDLFDGSEGEWITASEAARKQERFLCSRRKEGIDDPIRAEFFGKDILLKLLRKKDAVGIRFYFGENEDGSPSLVLVATNSERKNVIPDQTALKDMPDGTGNYGGNGPKCPQYCG